MKGRPSRLLQVIKSNNDKLTFGKYKEKTIMEVMDLNPSYIIWLDDEGIVEFPDDGEILDLAATMDMENNHLEDGIDYWDYGADDD